MKKATFQKPDATYPHGSLREQPEMKEPERKDYEKGRIYQLHLLQWKEYEANCRTIPCSENNWKDGQELEEGKDYKRDLIDDGGWTGKWVAVPIVQKTEPRDIDIYDAVRFAQETEDELWNELKNDWVTKSTIRKGVNEIISDLRAKFTIQRRKQ